MWAGASVQIEYFIYGAILMTFGFTFAQALSLILIGNLSYLLLGLCSLQGPQAGTTVFSINRAPYGPNGSRLISLFNWLTQIGFEVEGLILIVGAALVLQIEGGIHAGRSRQGDLRPRRRGHPGCPAVPRARHRRQDAPAACPPVSHALRRSAGLRPTARNGAAVARGADWQTYTEGLAFTIALSGLGWAECGNDYSRYSAPNLSKPAMVGWVFLGTAIPEILIMTLGAAVGTFIKGLGTGTGGFLPLARQRAIPAWFVTVFLIFASSSCSPSTASTCTPQE